MKQSTKKAGARALGKLEAEILCAAATRIAGVLRPLPAASAQEINEALQSLRDAGLVHGARAQPNLTLAGRDLARALAGRSA